MISFGYKFDEKNSLYYNWSFLQAGINIFAILFKAPNKHIMNSNHTFTRLVENPIIGTVGIDFRGDQVIA